MTYAAPVLRDLPLDVLASLRSCTWLALLDAYGFPAGLTRADLESLSAPELTTRVLDEADLLPLPLARALATIVAFSTEDARRDVYNAAEPLEHPRRWTEATSPADLIAQILAEAVTDPAAALLLDAANTLRDRSFRPRSTYLYFGPVQRGGVPTRRTGARVDSLFAAWCRSRDFGRVVSATERASGAILTFSIIHEDRARTDVFAASAEDDSTLHVNVNRPLRSHLVTYEAARRRLEITTDGPEAVTPLARIFGEVLFGDPRHFLDPPAVDLWKLQEFGPTSLHVPELASKLSVSAIGGTWQSGKGHAMTPRGDDLFKALSRYKIRVEGGRFDLLTLRARVLEQEDGPGQCDVALRPPHLCTVSEPELKPLLDDFLDGARITAPEPRARDFFAKQPWNDPSAGWVASEGEEGFASLVASGILKANPENRAVTPPDHPHAGPTATAYRLHGTTFLAWSPDPTVAPFLIEEKDLVAYVLQFGKLAAAIASALGLEGPATKLDEDGVLHCGRRTLGPTFVLVFLATRPIRTTTAERLRDRAGHGHAVLVAPEGRPQPGGLRQIAMPKLAGPWQPLLAEIVRLLRLEDVVDATVFAPPGARFVLHRASGRVWLDGVACMATERHFRLLEFLIEHDGREAYTKDIAEHVARGRAHEDTTRKQIDSLVVAIEKSFKAAGRKPPKDLRELVAMPRLGHYVLRAKGHIV
ncbi:MAG TPA: hypothetical protein VGI39_24440 [Polyangiaceae bacterium]